LNRELFEKVTRVEVIDSSGRGYTKYGVTGVELSLQDDDRTLKIFLTETAKDERED
jgi:hypothetical protein